MSEYPRHLLDDEPTQEELAQIYKAVSEIVKSHGQAEDNPGVGKLPGQPDPKLLDLI